MESNTRKITKLGQSIWLDNIQRKILENGELKSLIDKSDLRGVTSNPTIFNNAIAKSSDYDTALVSLAWSGWDAEKIFWELAIEDIKQACDLFSLVYEETDGGDGFVSIEESPFIAHDTEAAIVQAQQLWERVARPNLFIKIPATPEGIPAIQHSLAAGININITLIFSLERYAEVMEAYLSGLEQRLAASLPINNIASVASFFVSRVDTKIDSQLPENSPLRGKAAVANAKLAYDMFLETFKGERWEKLKKQGARLQRPLWASTSTKNPAYPDTLYMDNLVGPNTVNTVPLQTLDAFRDHGKTEVTITRDLEESHQVIDQLEAAGISMKKVTQELEDEGVQAFSESFESLLKTIDERRINAIGSLGELAEPVSKRVAQLEADSVPARLWNRDTALWSMDVSVQADIKNRLGWLDLPISSRAKISEIQKFVKEVRETRIKKFLLIGMGGSSLASEVFARLMPDAPCQFTILDSTDPAQIIEAARNFPPAETLYIISSKSGNTLEVNVLFDYFWELSGENGSHFIAICDPGTALETLARHRRFRKIFTSEPSVGGRFSALTLFGLVPAALIGWDLGRLLDSAEGMQKQCIDRVPAARNPGLTLGAVLGESALAGRDKVTIIADRQLASIGSWIEQLIAESSGKQGKGLVPVDLEPVGTVSDYGKDRLFVYFRQTGEHDKAITKFQGDGQSVVRFPVPDSYSFTAEVYRWEVAIAIACHILGVNAFDQPDVQDSKERTQAKTIAYLESGKFQDGEPIFENNSLKLFSNMRLTGQGLANDLPAFLDSVRPNNYIAINAYLPRNPETVSIIDKLRLAIRLRTKCATTVGFGPRFLHSTGQLHKGGANNGLFVQITADPTKDVDVPSQALTFGLLQRAQALGDYEALAARNRAILRIHLKNPGELSSLIQVI